MSDFGPSYGFFKCQIISSACSVIPNICKTKTVALACIVGDETDLRCESWILLGTARRWMQIKDVESHLVCQLGFTTEAVEFINTLNDITVILREKNR